MKVYTYPATFERGKDMIGVYFRDIPGVTSGGDSVDDAVLQAKEALEFYLEDRLENRLSIPKPSEPDQVELAPNLSVWSRSKCQHRQKTGDTVPSIFRNGQTKRLTHEELTLPNLSWTLSKKSLRKRNSGTNRLYCRRWFSKPLLARTVLGPPFLLRELILGGKRAENFTRRTSWGSCEPSRYLIYYTADI